MRALNDALAESPASVAEPIRYAVESGGKRLRPVLCMAAYRAVRGDSERRTGARAAARVGAPVAMDAVCEVAAAVELIHTYSLVHDDLPCMDDDDLRRGRPSAHRAFDVPCAVVAGAALIPLAVGVAARGAARLGLPPAPRMAIIRELTNAAGAAGMVGGQLEDLEAEGTRSGVDELERIHSRKTGALLAASLRIGGLAGHGGAAVLEALGEFGRAIGLAFQVTDDVLDVTGTAAVLGKTAGKDAAAAKATFPGLLGVEDARRRAREEVDRGLAALRGANIQTRELTALAHLVVERDR